MQRFISTFAIVLSTSCAAPTASNSPPIGTIGEETVASISRPPQTQPFVASLSSIHFAFRPTSSVETFEGAHDTYLAESRASSLVVTPVHHGSASPRATAPSKVGRAIVGAPLSLGPTHVARGATTLHVGQRHHVDERGVLQTEGGEVAETLQNGQAGVEQSWTLSSAPAGSGPLTIDMAVSGEDFEIDDGEGLHFVDRKSGLGVSYGDATWVDASGNRQVVHPRLVDGHIVIEFPESLVASAAYPVTIDPIVSPESAVGFPTAAAGGNQTKPDLSYDSAHDMYLVVWEDQRGPLQAVYAARVSGTGGLLDPGGILIPRRWQARASAQIAPRVARSDSKWFVVWEEEFTTTDHDIIGSSVDSQGVVGPPVDIEASSQNSTQPALAWISPSAKFLIAFVHIGTVAHKRVDSTFSVLDSAPYSDGGPSGQKAPVVSNFGANGDIGFVAGNEIYSHGVDMSTNLPLVYNASNRASCPSGSPPDSVAMYSYLFTSTGYNVLAWSCAGSPGIHAGKTRFDQAYPTFGMSLLFETTTGGGSQIQAPPWMGPAHVFVGTDTTSHSLNVTRVIPWSTTEIDSLTVDATGTARGRMIWDNTRYVAAYSKPGPVGYDIYLQTYTASPSLAKTTHVINGMVDRDHGFAATNFSSAGPTGLANLTWQDRDVAVDGSVTGGNVLLPNGVLDVTTASDGVGRLVVWRDSATATIKCMVRAGASGAFSPCSGPVGTGYSPRAAWTGSQYVVVYTNVNAEVASNVRISRISTAGVVEASARTLTADTAIHPDVACSSTTCTVVYEHHIVPDFSSIWRARMRVSDGALLDAAAGSGVVDRTIQPQIAARSDGFLVVGYADNPDIVLGVRLDAGGTGSGSNFQIGTTFFWGYGGLPRASVTVTSSGDYVVVYEAHAWTGCSDIGGEADLYASTVPGLSGDPGPQTLIQASVVPSDRHLRSTGSSVLIPYTKLAGGCGLVNRDVFYRTYTP